MLHYTIPNFYREITTYFNESMAKSKTQNIQRNMKFTIKNMSLCFINWMICGILLVEDVLSKGTFKEWTKLSNFICKYNWLCEQKILKNVFMKIKPNERCI